MDYVFEGQWSDDLRTKVIDQALAAWGEENAGQELTDFIQESLAKAKTMAEFSTDVLVLKLGKTKVKKLARKLGELLRSHQAATTAFAAQAVKTAESVSAPSMKKPAMEPVERTKLATGDHLMGQHQGHVHVDSSLTPSRDGRYHHPPHDKHHAQDDQHGNDNVTSQLGKRQMDNEEEPACDQQHHGPVRGRNVRPREEQQQSSSGEGNATISDQLRRVEEHNRVAVELGFRNAQEMLAMASAGRAVPMMPPVAHAPYYAPYCGGGGGYHPYPGYVSPSHGYGSSTNQASPHPGSAPNALGSAQLSFGYGPMMADAVMISNAVHAAQHITHAINGPPPSSDRMTFFNVTGEGEALEVCHFPRELGRFPSFFDSFKQSEAVGSDFIFQRTRPVDQSRFGNTITVLKEGDHAIWCGHPGIGKSTEANFVLLEFLRHLGDGEDSEWPTKVAHRVSKQLFLYTWNAVTSRVECDMLPGETLDDVEDFSIYWQQQKMVTKKKPPVLFLELEETERDPLVSIPTFIALHSRDFKKTLKSMDKGGRMAYFLVRPHEPEEVLLMAKVMFDADPEQLCAHLACKRSWNKVAKILSKRMGIVGPLVRQVFSKKRAFDDYVEEMEAKATKYFVAPYPVESTKDMKHEFKYLSRYAALLLAKE